MRSWTDPLRTPNLFTDSAVGSVPASRSIEAKSQFGLVVVESTAYVATPNGGGGCFVNAPNESPQAREATGAGATPSSVSSTAAAVSDAELEALLRPAMLRLGDAVLSGVEQLRLSAMLRRLSSILSEGLGDEAHRRSIRFEILTGGDHAGARDPAFGFVLASREAEVACVATLDRASARAMVDVIETQLADLRGTGEITPTEHGLLEYAVLSALDEIDSSGTGHLAVDRFLRRGELSNRSIFEGFDALDIRVTVAGREGVGTIWFPKKTSSSAIAEHGFPPRATDEPDVGAGGLAADGTVQVMLALPQVTLSLDEVRAVRAGDVIVLGATDLASFATNASLVTTNAWRLADAKVDRDGPDLVTVSCGSLRIDVFDPRTEREDLVCLVPVTGSHRMTFDQLRRWQPGAAIDLKKPGGANVDLLRDSSWFASGEMVRVDGEVGIRILELEESADAPEDHDARDEAGGTDPGDDS